MLASTSTPSFEDFPRVTRLLSAANRHSFVLAWAACVLAVTPIGILGWDGVSGSLGANPLERVLRTPGRWALILLLVVLSATPLRHALVSAARYKGIRYGRRLADWNWMITLRRPLGLASFFYALAHVVLYLSLDVGFNWEELAKDLSNKPFIIAGSGAFLLLLPLAVTSTDTWVHRLKRDWKRLHLLVYPAAVLAVLHFFWLSKPGVGDPYVYALALVFLLGYRIAARWLRVRVPVEALGEEVDERPFVASPERPGGGVTTQPSHSTDRPIKE